MPDHFTAKQWDFIKKAEKVTSFNLKERDFTTNDNQEMIRHLYEKHFFPDLSDHFIKRDKITLKTLNDTINKLRKNSNFTTLVETKYGDMGPGEVMLFIIDDARLAGGNESGDLRIKNDIYELKAVRKNKNDQYVDFFLGGTVPQDDLIKDFKQLAVDKKVIPTDRTTEISGSKTVTLRTSAKAELEAIERKFATRAAEYLTKYPVMFVDNTPRNKGHIFEYGKISEDRIQIERLTQGKLKPAIQAK